MKKFLVLGAAAAALLSGPAFAANLVTNGSFEDGFNGWTVSSTSGTQPVVVEYGNAGGYPFGAFGEAINVDDAVSASPDAAGKHALYFSSDTTRLDIVYQSIELFAGVTYTVGLDAYAPLNGLNNPFDAHALFYIGEETFGGGANVKSFLPKTWTNGTATFTPLFTKFYEVGIAFQTDSRSVTDYAADLAIDRVFVNTPAVPEPTTWAMMIGGLALVGVSMRRSRTTAVSFA